VRAASGKNRLRRKQFSNGDGPNVIRVAHRKVGIQLFIVLPVIANHDPFDVGKVRG
jgi:hypothetical protein